MFLVRGENVLLLGEIVGKSIWASAFPSKLTTSKDLDKDDYIPETYRQVSESEVFDMRKEEQEAREMVDKAKAKKLQKLGFETEHAGEVDLRL